MGKKTQEKQSQRQNKDTQNQKDNERRHPQGEDKINVRKNRVGDRRGDKLAAETESLVRGEMKSTGVDRSRDVSYYVFLFFFLSIFPPFFLSRLIILSTWHTIVQDCMRGGLDAWSCPRKPTVGRVPLLRIAECHLFCHTRSAVASSEAVAVT